MEPRGRWWNGRFGKLARRDIWLLTDGAVWRVEARTGDADSRKWRHDYVAEQEARAVVAAMIDRTGGPAQWRDLFDARSSSQSQT
jgi:hypothetical protein